MTLPYDTVRTQLIDAIIPLVPFDGWSEAAFKAAVRDAGLDIETARAVCPRGALDLASAYHRRSDAAMVAWLESEDLSEMRFRDRIAAAIRYRLENVEDRELVRRATTLYALPTHAAEGAGLIWETADAIWDALGDTSDDVNWYTKRATLSGVYSATVLYWLGDGSDGQDATWSFLDRRIDDVMSIEKVKAHVRDSPILSRLLAGPNWVLGRIRAPSRMPKMNLPGSWPGPRD